jgi:osmotically inducible protein OsmC
MGVERTANAQWKGDLTGGSGTVSTASGVVEEATVKWSTRAERADQNTSPEELIAAAHASCISMALAHGLAEAGNEPRQLDTEATATFDQVDGGFKMTTMLITIRGQVDGLEENAFRKAAEVAAENCPVSQALKGNVEVTLDASLV